MMDNDQSYIIEAYQYLNTLDSNQLTLIPNKVWQYFEKNIDMPNIKINKNLKLSDKANQLVEYIIKEYICF